MMPEWNKNVNKFYNINYETCFHTSGLSKHWHNLYNSWGIYSCTDLHTCTWQRHNFPLSYLKA